MGLLESLGPATFKIIMQVGLALMVVIVLGALYYASNKGFSAWRRYKNFKIKAVIFHPDGSFTVRKIGKFKGKDGIDKMLMLGTKETMPVIDPKYIRNLTVTLWRYGVGQYALIPPKVWEKLDPKKFNIDIIDFQMKNFAFLEQRAAVSRWATIKDTLAKYGHYITLIVLAIVAGVAVWFMMKTGMGMHDSVVTARVAECTKIIGGGSSVAPPV